MAKKRPACPQCGGESLRMTRTFAIAGKCHYLECKRMAYYHCADCGCDCLLTTPQGELEIIHEGRITRAMAERVLDHLGLDRKLAARID